MPFELIRNDITNMHVEVIVNAANMELSMGGGVCGAIFTAAGTDLLQSACNRIGHCDVGEAVLTEGFKLPAKYIIHTVGPVWRGGSYEEATLLQACYRNSLVLAKSKGFESIAFPLIASGIYGYPKEEALKIAMDTIKEFLAENDMKVYLVVFDHKAVQLSKAVANPLQQFIDDHYVDEHEKKDSRRKLSSNVYHTVGEVVFDILETKSVAFSVAGNLVKNRKLEDVVKQMDESFAQMLLRLIDEKGMTDVETYRKANVDRRLFSKIRKDMDYCPSKSTAIAFAIALKLNLDTTKDLLAKAGYSLSRSYKFDVIIEYFIENEVYDIFEINEGLFAYDQSLLGA